MGKVYVFDILYKSLSQCDFTEVFVGFNKMLDNCGDVENLWKRSFVSFLLKKVVLEPLEHITSVSQILGLSASILFKTLGGLREGTSLGILKRSCELRDIFGAVWYVFLLLLLLFPLLFPTPFSSSSSPFFNSSSPFSWNTYFENISWDLII